MGGLPAGPMEGPPVMTKAATFVTVGRCPDRLGLASGAAGAPCVRAAPLLLALAPFPGLNIADARSSPDDYVC